MYIGLHVKYPIFVHVFKFWNTENQKFLFNKMLALPWTVTTFKRMTATQLAHMLPSGAV